MCPINDLRMTRGRISIWLGVGLVGAGLLCLAAYQFGWLSQLHGSSQALELAVEAEPWELFQTRPIGDAFDVPPRISYVKIIDLNRDQLLDVVVCDCTTNRVSWIRQSPAGIFEELTLAEDLAAPARVECVDFDGDGDYDVFVACLGQLFPTNDRVGSLVALENIGDEKFERRDLLEQVARVADVRAGDLDQDGDLDLAVTQFGYNDGETQWLENVGDWQFQPHPLQALAGGIHSIIADINGDGVNDIVLLVSQEVETIFAFVGTGNGEFREQKLHSADNPDFGSAGIWLDDLDRDGDLDILYCNGDAFDYSPPRPWPWHGLQWLENVGDCQFRAHRVLDFGGAVNSAAVDFDGDDDTDIFVSSAFNDWHTPESQSLLVLENEGNMNFRQHALANAPSHIQALDVGDVNGDGRLDLVTGGMHVSEPYDRVERIMLWEGNARMPAHLLESASVPARP